MMTTSCKRVIGVLITSSEWEQTTLCHDLPEMRIIMYLVLIIIINNNIGIIIAKYFFTVLTRLPNSYNVSPYILLFLMLILFCSLKKVSTYSADCSHTHPNQHLTVARTLNRYWIMSTVLVHICTLDLYRIDTAHWVLHLYWFFITAVIALKKSAHFWYWEKSI